LHVLNGHTDTVSPWCHRAASSWPPAAATDSPVTAGGGEQRGAVSTGPVGGSWVG
jgi:hypothetical protein